MPNGISDLSKQNERKRITVFCNRYLGFTLLASGGVLEDLIDHFDVTIITAPSAISSIESATGNRCSVIPYKPKSRQDNIFSAISDIFAMTYARYGTRKNLTGQLHRKAHLDLARKKGFIRYLRKSFIVFIAAMAENSKPLRQFLSFLFYRLAPKIELISLLRQTDPALCIATTTGLGEDGIFFAASRALDISDLALIQSWDRTASKGYPPLHPDHCIVWNEAMADEAEYFLDMPRERIYTCGAPPWDKYLSDHAPLNEADKINFFKKWNLDISRKLIFIALNGPATHTENLRLMRTIANAKGQFENVQFLFRSHPAYLTDAKKSGEISALFEKFQNSCLHLMTPIVKNPESKDYIVTDDDRIFMHQMFKACDLTISIMSTWMIESSIFDKPNICIEYGRYMTELYDFDLSEYKAEHIQRIYNYDAVYRVRSPEELIATISNVLQNPAEKQKQRRILSDGETGPHKGASRQAFLSKILEITNNKL